MKTTAAILVAQKQPLVLEEIGIPALRFGQVLVRVTCSGICGSQLGEIDGVKGPDKFLPHLLGHEGAGEVLEIGEGVKHVAPGDHVVLHWRKGVGIEAPAPKYDSKLGTVNAGWVTTFNDHAIISENRLTKIPKGFDDEAAALMGCAVTTGFGVINNNAQVRIGESVVVLGAGGIGLSIVQGAALAGANPIIAVDRYRNRLELAGKLGATHLIETGGDLEAQIRAIAGPGGVDVAIDNTGNVEVIELAYRLTSDRGRTVFVGVPPKGSAARLYTLPLHFDKWVTGSHGGESEPQFDIPRFVGLCNAGRLDLAPLVGKRYPLAQINEAIADMRSGAVAGRCIIRMGG